MNLNEFFPIWDKLAPEHQSLLSQSAFPRSIPKGTVIHNGSMDCAGLYAVKKGQLRAYILSDEGREVTIYRLFDRDICLFSASCMIRSIQFEIIIQAEKDTQVLVIPPESYKRVMEDSAPLANFTNEVMATRFSEVMWRVEQMMWKRFDARLAAFLLEESALEESNVLRLTHEQIGSHVGSPREVVTRMLRYFQSEGMVALSRGTVELTDKERLEELSGQ